MGLAQGPSAEHGDGAPREIPAEAVCGTFDVHEATGAIAIHWEIEDSGPREPYRVTALVDAGDLETAIRPRPAAFEMPDPPPDR